MTADPNNQGNLEARLKEMEEENELLLLQLQQVQEELEHYFLRNQELEKGQSAGSQQGKGWVDDELPDVLAENERLRAVVEVQRKVHQLESQNALNARLGDILIKGVDAPGTLLSVPGKLGRIWRQASRQTPPGALGGKGFDKVIAAYGEGGFDTVEKLLAGVSIAPAMQANAYTALARQLMNSDRANTAEAARRAHALDPKPYRLKWLAFRLHEAGDVIEAEAMLDILPPDAHFSESEARQASQLRYEARHALQREAKQKTGFSERRAKVENQLKSLAIQRDERATQSAERQTRIEQLTQEKAALEASRGHEIEVLGQAKTRLEEEKAALAEQYEEQAKELAKRQAQIEQLTQAKAALEAERDREIDALNQVKARLEEEKAALASQFKEQGRLSAERQVQIEQLTEAKAALEAQYKEQGRLSAEKLEEAENLAARLQGELRETRQAASLSLKLQMLREADLKDLQARYQASLEREEHQHQLLTNLGQRLRVAATYYHQIANREPQVLPRENANALGRPSRRKRVSKVKHTS